MNRKIAGRWVIAVILITLLALVGLAFAPKKPAQVQARLEGLPVAQGTFERADGPRPLQFPRDHGAHPDFQTEWWYTTGNLVADSGERFGYQLTFFRRALVGEDERDARTSAWAADQVYLAHFTLSDIDKGRFHAFERFERGGAGLAGAQGEPAFGVWLDDWSVEQAGADEYRLRAAREGVQIDLLLKDLKGPVLQGDRGYSQKGPEAGNASYYISQTRLETTGSVRVDGDEYTVSGSSWSDHEFSTSALGPDQVGWDWFSIQLDDGSELMVYTIRRADGSVDAYSKGTLIYPDGSTRALAKDDFQVQVETTWRSLHSDGVYPAAWTVRVPSEGLTLRIQPHTADQELNLSFVYWEGAVKVEGEKNGVAVKGNGYVELTGYAQSLAGRF